jgi:hypothetical protein
MENARGTSGRSGSLGRDRPRGTGRLLPTETQMRGAEVASTNSGHLRSARREQARESFRLTRRVLAASALLVSIVAGTTGVAAADSYPLGTPELSCHAAGQILTSDLRPLPATVRVAMPRYGGTRIWGSEERRFEFWAQVLTWTGSGWIHVTWNGPYRSKIYYDPANQAGVSGEWWYVPGGYPREILVHPGQFGFGRGWYAVRLFHTDGLNRWWGIHLAATNPPIPPGAPFVVREQFCYLP